MKKLHRTIKFKQKAWLKSYIHMKSELRKKAKVNFKKDFFKMINNEVFEKIMGNVAKHRDIKLVTIERKKTI